MCAGHVDHEWLLSCSFSFYRLHKAGLLVVRFCAYIADISFKNVSSMIPSARPIVPTNSDHYFQATFVLRYFEKWGRLVVRTETCAKILITTGRDCGAAEWINFLQKCVWFFFCSIPYPAVIKSIHHANMTEMLLATWHNVRHRHEKMEKSKNSKWPTRPCPYCWTAILFFGRMYGQTEGRKVKSANTICKTNDHLFGLGLVGQYSWKQVSLVSSFLYSTSWAKEFENGLQYCKGS